MTITIPNLAERSATVREIIKSAPPGFTQVECWPIEDHVLPIVIIKGLSAGPSICVSAGVHGSEYCAIEAAQRLLKLPYENLAGTLIILPMVNTAAFAKRSVYINPADGKNLNRVFPGSATGTASDRLAAWLIDEVFSNTDALVDLHCGDLSESLTPFTIFCEGNERSERLARDFGLPYAIASPARGMMIAGAAAAGVPAIIAEAGGAGKYDEDAIQTLVIGLHRLLRAMHVLLDDSSDHPSKLDVQVLRCSSVTATASGLWYPTHAVGDVVDTDTVLGTIRNHFGEPIGSAVSPINGKIMFQISSLAVNGDETITWIGA
jgi:predicted deacylase